MKIGTWLDRSLTMSPLSHEVEMLLVKMLSIRVALYEEVELVLKLVGKENEKITH